MALKKINFIPNSDFAAASETDFAEIDVELYAVEEEPACTRDPRSNAESFLFAVGQSRLLTVEGEQFLFKRLNFLRFRASSLQATIKGDRKSRKTQKEIDRLLNEAAATREQIACANLRLATSIVRKLAGSHEEFDEFLAEANAILLNAIDKFDYSRGYRFSTYATHAVQRHTYRLIERQTKRRKRESADSDVLSAAAEQVTGKTETNDAELLAAANQIIASFDKTLNEREQFIVRERFGLNGSGNGKSLRAIGDDLGLSKERVRQLLHQSVEKLAELAKPLESVFDQL